MTKAMRIAVIGLAVGLGLTGASLAQDPTALQISGVNTGVEVSFGLAELDALPQIEIVTSTIWTDGDVVFQGPSLRDVLSAAEAEGETLTLTALNDYAIEMPAPSAEEIYPILATRQNGQPMQVREKGPFWIVFPYDSDPMYQTEEVYSQSIWQLDRIDVRD